jgi:hypothetical protein
MENDLTICELAVKVAQFVCDNSRSFDEAVEVFNMAASMTKIQALRDDSSASPHSRAPSRDSLNM